MRFLTLLTLLSFSFFPTLFAETSVEEEELKSTIASDPAHRKTSAKGTAKRPPAPGGEIKVDESQKRIVTGKIRFAPDSADLMPETLPILKQLATFLAKNELRVRIEGHTDSLGSDQKNLGLSQKRADAVKEILVKEGVSLQRLEAIGVGDTRLLASDVTPAGQEKNRRVEFHIVPPPPPPTPEVPPTPAPEPAPSTPPPVIPESLPQPTTLPTPYPPTPPPPVPVLPSPTPPPMAPPPATPGMVP